MLIVGPGSAQPRRHRAEARNARPRPVNGRWLGPHTPSWADTRRDGKEQENRLTYASSKGTFCRGFWEQFLGSMQVFTGFPS